MAISFLPPSQILASKYQTSAASHHWTPAEVCRVCRWQLGTKHYLASLLLEPKQAMSFFTNNDIEGWHNGLKKCASGRAQMPLYMLVHLLHKEAYLVAYQIRLVSKRKLTKLQKKITTQSKRKYQATGSSMPSTKSQQLNYSKLVPMSMDQ